MTTSHAKIVISYNAARRVGQLRLVPGELPSSVWEQLRARLAQDSSVAFSGQDTFELSWPQTLDILREFGPRRVQDDLNFRFEPDETARDKVSEFAREFKLARQARDNLKFEVEPDKLQAELGRRGFVRELKGFQARDLSHCLSLANAANFSVPGAGKTTVALAAHTLVRRPETKLLVVAPKSAFPAWADVIKDCFASDAPDGAGEPLFVLDGREDDTAAALNGPGSRFLISYDLMVRQQTTIANFISSNRVHLVLDEAHRMKAGALSQRGAFLISIANLAARRDILTGTPMPQSANDLASQLQFLWPGHGLEIQIQRGATPRQVLGQLYVRTTKRELGLTPAQRHFHQVEMAEGQLALYSAVRDDTLRTLSQSLRGPRTGFDFRSARRSVMRLLQLSSNPILALQGMSRSSDLIKSAVAQAVVDEGTSRKMIAVADHARRLAGENQKTVIWTIFTQNIYDLETLLADLNPVTLYGQVPSGDETDLSTREGRLLRFHKDPACKVLIANPAAAGEGISLHTVCHNAIYLDRSYVSTHYLQSIDRIHRLGLPPGVETHIHIYECRAPAGIGSVDLSVRRRLALKIRNLQDLLNDPDLHEIALDEESADDPIDYDIDIQDIVDLIAEFEGKASTPSAD